MSKYILVVDDQFGVRFFIHRALEESGYIVKAVASGSECLFLATSDNRPSLILLDQNMPTMTGLQVLTLLAQDDQAKNIPVVMITAESDVEAAAQCLGVRNVLTKPLELEILLKTVEAILSEAS